MSTINLLRTTAHPQLPWRMLTAVFLITGLVIGTGGCDQLSAGDGDGTPATASDVEMVAHRGANHQAPENTRAAAEAAIQLGVGYVEVDVRASSDSVLYIMHDATVDRTTNGAGAISELPSSVIDTLDAGSWYGEEFAGESVPRLASYLEWIEGKAGVYLDVKGGDLQQIIDLVYETGMDDNSFFWFGDRSQALAFRELDQDLSLKINADVPEDIGDAVERYQADIIEAGLDEMTPAFLEACRTQDVRLMAILTGEQDPEAFRQALRVEEVELVNLDDIEAFLAARSSLGQDS